MIKIPELDVWLKGKGILLELKIIGATALHLHHVDINRQIEQNLTLDIGPVYSRSRKKTCVSRSRYNQMYQTPLRDQTYRKTGIQNNLTSNLPL